jgi:hypothetical protein
MEMESEEANKAVKAKATEKEVLFNLLSSTCGHALPKWNL